MQSFYGSLTAPAPATPGQNGSNGFPDVTDVTDTGTSAWASPEKEWLGHRRSDAATSVVAPSGATSSTGTNGATSFYGSMSHHFYRPVHDELEASSALGAQDGEALELERRPAEPSCQPARAGASSTGDHGKMADPSPGSRCLEFESLPAAAGSGASRPRECDSLFAAAGSGASRPRECEFLFAAAGSGASRPREFESLLAAAGSDAARPRAVGAMPPRPDDAAAFRAWLLRVDPGGGLVDYAETLEEHYDTVRQVERTYSVVLNGRRCIDGLFFEDMGVVNEEHRRCFARWFSEEHAIASSPLPTGLVKTAAVQDSSGYGASFADGFVD